MANQTSDLPAIVSAYKDRISFQSVLDAFSLSATYQTWRDTQAQK